MFMFFFQVDENMAKVKKLNPVTDGKKELKAPNRHIQAPVGAPKQIPITQATTPNKANNVIPNNTIEGQVSTGRYSLQNEGDEKSDFTNRRKAALAAQKNDYKSANEDTPPKNIPRNTEVSCKECSCVVSLV